MMMQMVVYILLTGSRFEIFVLEASRLWNYWLGLPVAPRSWKIQLPKEPGRDEL